MFNFNLGMIFTCLTQAHSRTCYLQRAWLGMLILLVGAPSFATTLSLQEAQQLALNQDIYFQGSKLEEAAYQYDSDAADRWDNPTITTTLQSVPTDGFSLNQEPMTQLKLGIRQAMPRGDSASISRTIAIEQAQKEPVKRAARRAWLLREVSMDWLAWYQAEQTVVLLREETQSIVQLLEMVESSYRSGVGGTQQQDIIQLRLERLRLEDTLLQEQQAASVALAQLSRWFDFSSEVSFTVPETLNHHDIYPFNASFARQVERRDLLNIIDAHPSVQLLAKDEIVATQKLSLAKEQTKPMWAFEAAYGYRQDAQNGISQADFVSVGVQVDLPLFSSKRQDANVSASAARLGATSTQRRLEVRRLAALAEASETQLVSLLARQQLFDTALIAQSERLAESALNAYMADKGAFDDVMRARISHISAKLDALALHVDIAKNLAELAYLYYPLIKEQPKDTHRSAIGLNRGSNIDTHTITAIGAQQ
ncbi:TolC family protein [Alteromonas sp. MMG017]|uniref:TolC family protein n=1 Tax=Alteromonas sp. MMG017 TaxID=2822692 RepID=UPI001B3A3667|nr:TolC family protein [Alteromonas sp. MMG017]MBQ4830905.1 TolC family protein [Alteromonas sp. MMG017]